MRIAAVLGETADYWDSQRVITEGLMRQTVDHWVGRNASLGRQFGGEAMYWAVVGPMTLAQGFVDVLRLGRGMQSFWREGSYWGLAQYGLRLLAPGGPLAW